MAEYRTKLPAWNGGSGYWMQDTRWITEMLVSAASSQQLSKRVSSHGMPEKMPLALVALLRQKECVLFRCLHALGNDALPEIFTHADHGADDGGIVRAAGYLIYEWLVNLQSINREFSQIA